MQNKIIAGILAVLVIGGGAYAIFHKSPSASNPYSTASTSSTQTKPATSAAIIQTKTDASLGQYLAGSNGAALYTYGADTTGVSNCTGSCLYSWPIYAATSSSASMPANVTVITRSDGGSQYAYKGMPLYTFSSDSSGKVTGDNVANFHVAKP